MSEVALVSVAAQAYYSDASSGQWAPFSAGYTQLSIYYSSTSLSYRIIGQNLDDGAYVINAVLAGGGYTSLQPASETFFSLMDGQNVYGFNFYQADFAQSFSSAFNAALSHVNQIAAQQSVEAKTSLTSLGNAGASSTKSTRGLQEVATTPLVSQPHAIEEPAPAAPAAQNSFGAALGAVKLKKTSTSTSVSSGAPPAPAPPGPPPAPGTPSLSGAAPAPPPAPTGSLTDALKGLNGVKLKKVGPPSADSHIKASADAIIAHGGSSPAASAPKQSIGSNSGAGAGNLFGEMQMKLNKRKDTAGSAAPETAPKPAASSNSSSGVVDFKSQLKGPGSLRSASQQSSQPAEPKPSSASNANVDNGSIYQRFNNNNKPDSASGAPPPPGQPKIKVAISPGKATPPVKPAPQSDDWDDDSAAPAKKPEPHKPAPIAEKAPPPPVASRTGTNELGADFDWIKDMQANIAPLESPGSMHNLAAGKDQGDDWDDEESKTAPAKVVKAAPAPLMPKSIPNAAKAKASNNDDDWDDDTDAAPAKNVRSAGPPPLMAKKSSSSLAGSLKSDLNAKSELPPSDMARAASSSSESLSGAGSAVSSLKQSGNNNGFQKSAATLPDNASLSSSAGRGSNSNLAAPFGKSVPKSGSKPSNLSGNAAVSRSNAELPLPPPPQTSELPPAKQTSKSNLSAANTSNISESSTLSPELLALKNEIVSEFKQELQIVKREIVGVFLQEMLKMAQALASDEAA